MPSRCIPRAIAPLVTTTTSTPVRCSAATSSTIRAITDRRSSPESSATIDEPSLTTATGMPRTLGGVELEHHAAELDVVARFEPLCLQRGDHAHAAQAVLDVRERLVVLEVVAGDQAVDGLAGHAECAVGGALDHERAAACRAEDLELGDLVLARVLGERLGDRYAVQELAAEVVEALTRRGGGDEHRRADALAP